MGLQLRHQRAHHRTRAAAGHRPAVDLRGGTQQQPECRGQGSAQIRGGMRGESGEERLRRCLGEDLLQPGRGPGTADPDLRQGLQPTRGTVGLQIGPRRGDRGHSGAQHLVPVPRHRTEDPGPGGAVGTQPLRGGTHRGVQQGRCGAVVETMGRRDRRVQVLQAVPGQTGDRWRAEGEHAGSQVADHALPTGHRTTRAHRTELPGEQLRRTHRTAGSVGRLVDGDLPAGLGQQAGGGQPIGTGPYNGGSHHERGPFSWATRAAMFRMNTTIQENRTAAPMSSRDVRL